MFLAVITLHFKQIYLGVLTLRMDFEMNSSYKHISYLKKLIAAHNFIDKPNFLLRSQIYETYETALY